MTFLLGSEPFIGKIKNPKIHAFHSYWHTEYGTDDLMTAFHLSKMLDYAAKKDAALEAFKVESRALMERAKEAQKNLVFDLVALVKKTIAEAKDAIETAPPPFPPAEFFLAQGGVVTPKRGDHVTVTVDEVRHMPDSDFQKVMGRMKDSLRIYDDALKQNRKLDIPGHSCRTDKEEIPPHTD